MMYTPGQLMYQRALMDPRIPIVIVTGPAGSGKTLLASTIGARHVADGRFAKLVITRPSVSVDEQHGFLPGDLNKKMEPWMRPITESVHKSNKKPPIEVCPLGFMRGRTFDTSWIIADEMQNSTPNQMKMVMTRVGHGSKLVITGDPSQYDRGFDGNGLDDLIRRVNARVSEYIKHVELSEEDVRRSEVVKEVLRLYI
jgi:phosphate starvation-inducible PhoH-like protein